MEIFHFDEDTGQITEGVIRSRQRKVTDPLEIESLLITMLLAQGGPVNEQAKKEALRLFLKSEG